MMKLKEGQPLNKLIAKMNQTHHTVCKSVGSGGSVQNFCGISGRTWT